MAQRSTTSEYQPAPPFYQSQGKTSRTPGAPQARATRQAGGNAGVAPIRQLDATGQRINTAGQVIGITEDLAGTSVSTAITP